MSFRQENISAVPEEEEKSSETVENIVTDLAAEEVFDMFYHDGSGGQEEVTGEEYVVVVETFGNRPLKEALLRFANIKDTICPLKFGKYLGEILKYQQPVTRVR